MKENKEYLKKWSIFHVYSSSELGLKIQYDLNLNHSKWIWFWQTDSKVLCEGKRPRKDKESNVEE